MAIVAMAMFYFGFNFLKGTDFFSKTSDYYAIFDNVGALVPSSPVKINGVVVGRVKETEILQDRGNKVAVTLEIKRSVAIPRGSRAILTSELLGGALIQLEMSKSTAMFANGDTITAMVEKGIKEVAQEKIVPVLQTADSLMKGLNKVVGKFEGTATYLNQLLQSSDRTVLGVNTLVNANTKSLAGVLANMNALTASLVETEKALKPILAKTNTLADSLASVHLGETLNRTNAAVASLQNILTNLQKGQGTAGKLLKSDALYNNLNYTIVSLNNLLTNFREQPKRYVNLSIFGKKETGPAKSVIQQDSL